jgi:hypothetical protein
MRVKTNWIMTGVSRRIARASFRSKRDLLLVIQELVVVDHYIEGCIE